MTSRILLLINLLFGGFNLFSQNNLNYSVNNIDSVFFSLYNSGNYKMALPLAKKRVELYSAKNDSNYVYALNNLGSVYGNLGMNKEEEDCFTKMKIEAEKIFSNQHKTYIMSLLGLGHAYTYRGDFKKAENIFKQAISFSEKIADEDIYIEAIVDLSEVYNFTSKFDSSENLLIKAKSLVLQKKGKTTKIYADIIAALGILYYQLSDYEEAAQHMQELVNLQIKSQGKEHPMTAMAMNNLAVLYQRMDNLSAAENLFEEITEINIRTLGKEHPNYAQSISNLAFVYSLLGKHLKAEQLYLESITIRKKVFGEIHPRYASSLENLAMLYELLEETEKEEKLRLQALIIREKIEGKNHIAYSNALVQLGMLYTKMRDFKKAKSFFEEAEKISINLFGIKSKDYLSVANSHSTLYIEQKNFREAKLKLLKSLSINSIDTLSIFSSNEFISNDQAINSYTFLSKIYKSEFEEKGLRDYLDSSYLCIKAALNISETIRNKFIHEDDKFRSLQNMNEKIAYMLDLVVLMNDSDKFDELLKYSELNKAVLMGDALKANRARTMSDLPDSLVNLESDLMEKMGVLNKKLIESNQNEERNKIKAEINSLVLEIEFFKLNIKNKYPKYHDIRFENITADAKSIQSLLEQESIFLEYFLTDKRIYVFSISKESIDLKYMEIDKDSLKNKIRLFHNFLSKYDEINSNKEAKFTIFTETAHWFYLNLIKPLIAEKNINHLIIVTDGELGHLPFETFITEIPDSKKVNFRNLKYLVKDFKISYNYSATLWKENLKHEPKDKGKGMLAIASSYNNKDISLEKIRTKRNTTLRGILQDLPEAKKEVESLEKKFKGSFLTGTDAIEKTFKSKSSDYSIIHLAMHGILNQQTPILSSLAFTENGDSTEDNFLEAWEISHLKLNAQLVVLSACETGYGKFQQGEGVMSLARAFMYAGVPSLVVSLWQVNDASTAEIMQLFYANLAKGMDKAEALRQAKLKYIAECKNPMMAHPAFWAAFVQIGDSRPVKIAIKGTSFWLWLLAAGLIVGMAFLFYKRGKNIYKLKNRKTSIL
jgi:CHAT domain-containing protein/Tfp pilus assembly protein PilF